MALTAVALFCDDVREEAQGTETIVGVYPSNISVSALPGQLERLALYIRTHVPPDVGLGEIVVSVTMPDGMVVEISRMQADFVSKAQQDASNNGFPFAVLITKASFPNFRVNLPGVVSVTIDHLGTRFIAGALNFRLTPPQQVGS